MTDDDPLGRARGARGVHDVGHVVDVYRWPMSEGSGSRRSFQAMPEAPTGPVVATRAPRWAVLAGSSRMPSLARMIFIPAKVEDAQLLGPAQARVQGDGNGPGLVDGHIGGEPFERFARGDGQRHPVSGSETLSRLFPQRDHGWLLGQSAQEVAAMGGQMNPSVTIGSRS